MENNITYELDVNNIYNFIENDDYISKKYNLNCVDYTIKYNKDKSKYYQENNYSKF